MILNFQTTFKDGSPTYFVDKISETFDFLDNEELQNIWDSAWGKFFGKEELNLLFKRWSDLTELPEVHQKLHSLREDIHDRWQIGAKLQRVYILDQKDGMGHARELLGVDLATFVLNDGFDSLEQFWNYFTENKTLKIIHWTNFKY